MIRGAALLAMAASAALAQTTPKPAPATARKPAAAAGLPNYTELKYPELRPIAAPAVDTVVLPNRMRLLLLENHELPLIDGTVLVRTGSAFDPPEKIGLAALAGQMMLEGGTPGRPADGLIRRFQDKGAEIDGAVSDNSLSISFSALKENANEVLDALKDALMAPEFPQDRLDFAKARMRNAIAHRNDDGAAILRREFIATVYGKNTPYGTQIEYATVDRINRGDLVAFYQRYFFPANLMLSLEGDFDTAAMKTRIAALFDDWKSEQPAVPEFPKVNMVSAPGKFLAVKKDVTQAFFAVGQLGGDYLDKDYPALQIMADILGGGPQGRLNRRLAGEATTLSATWTAGFGHPGLFQVRGSADPFRTTQVLQAVFQELNDIRASQVTEQELKTAKASAIASMVFAYDNQLSVLPRLSQFEYFHFPKDYTRQYQQALEGVTRADVLRVAKERLDPAHMTTVVVANPVAFELPLESLGGPAVIPIDLTIPPPKPEAALGDPASQRLGKQLLARAQQAMGGTDKLAAVTDYVQELAYQLDVGAGGAQSSMTERWLAPGYLRQDNVRADGKISVYCDGKTGWAASTTTHSSAALLGVQLKQVQSDLFRILFPLLLSDRTPGRKVNALDDRTVEISDGAGQIVRVVFDPGAGLLESVLYDMPTANGLVSVIDTYSDYRDVGGLKLPFKDTTTVAGQKYQEVTTRNMRIDTGLKIQDLEKRP
jgi:zinc protease